jgi:molybdopterin molybdotransferase
MPANDGRQSYLRARLIQDGADLWAEPFALQDSSALSVLAKADALIVRLPDAAPAEAGDRAEIISLDGF